MMQWCSGRSSGRKRGSDTSHSEVSDTQVRLVKERLEMKEDNEMGSNEQSL